MIPSSRSTVSSQGSSSVHLGCPSSYFSKASVSNSLFSVDETDQTVANTFSFASKKADFSLHTPGNVLLMGEYAILERGAKGVCLCLDVFFRSHLFFSLDFGFSFFTHSSPSVFSHQLPLPQENIFLELSSTPVSFHKMFIFLLEAIERKTNRKVQRASFILDSQDFFWKGEKKGYGSSACLVVNLFFSLYFLCLFSFPEPEDQEWLMILLKAHEIFQGRKGSGYDVCTSYFGYSGLFSQASFQEPIRFEPLNFFFSEALFSFFPSVSTTRTLKIFQEWKKENPEKWRRFCERSQAGVEKFCLSSDIPSLIALLEQAQRDKEILEGELGMRSIWEGKREKGKLDEEKKAQQETRNTPEDFVGLKQNSKNKTGYAKNMFLKSLGAGEEIFFGLSTEKKLSDFSSSHSDLKGLRLQEIRRLL